MKSVDVIVVGGGPAGSTCAWALKRQQVECILLDRAEFPRTKLCAGWITPEVVEDLEIEVATYPYRFLTFQHLHFHFPWVGYKSKNQQHSIRRYEFDAWLLDRSNVQVKCHEVENVRQDGDSYVIDEEYSCKYLVGAGGSRCPVYRTLFRESCPRDKLLQAVTLEEEFPYEYTDRACHLWFFENRLPGYAWYVPKANGYINIGIGAMTAKLKQTQNDIKSHWVNFTHKLNERGMVTDYDYEPRGYSYFIRGDVNKGRTGNAFILGDAAGLATRDLCEGIGPAVKSGLMASKSIVEGADFDLRKLARYSVNSSITKRVFDRKLHGA